MNRTLRGDVHYTDGELGISQCVWCRHRFADGRCCSAFPEGIPEAIARNHHDHRDPLDGDRGVRFEPEAVEIEFVDVEPAPESVPLTTEAVIAMARSGAAESQKDRAAAVEHSDPDNQLDEDAFELDIEALG